MKENVLNSAKQTADVVDLSLVLDAQGNFFFEVMYEGNILSRQPLPDKKPLWIVYEGFLIALEDAPSPLLWAAAMEYCAEIRVENDCATPGEDHLWAKFRNEDLGEKFNALAEYLGGKPLLLTERYWSSTFKNYFAGGCVWCWTYLSCGYTGYSKGYPPAWVRPVVRLPQ